MTIAPVPPQRAPWQLGAAWHVRGRSPATGHAATGSDARASRDYSPKSPIPPPLTLPSMRELSAQRAARYIIVTLPLHYHYRYIHARALSAASSPLHYRYITATLSLPLHPCATSQRSEQPVTLSLHYRYIIITVTSRRDLSAQRAARYIIVTLPLHYRYIQARPLSAASSPSS